jgi:imidazoleglycerol phosphate dehydratase HisB
VAYALAAPDLAAELNARQAPAPISTLSSELAIAALAAKPDVAPQLEERERFASALRAIGLEPLPSHTNFVYVPVEDGIALGDALVRQGIVVRAYPEAIRATVLDPADDDLLVETLARILDRPSPAAPSGDRRVRTLRATAETRLAVRLALDGASRVRVETGAGLYDHFLEQLAFHAGFDLILEGAGDLETGDHHTAEDAALALGQALDAALGDRRGIARYGDAVVPMDDALARAAVDLGGRPHAELKLEHDPGMAMHMLQSLSQAARAAVHVEASGRDGHHVAEAAFKAVGRALRAAVRPEGEGLPSTKGLL